MDDAIVFKTVLLALLLSSCSIVERPGVKAANRMLASFSHDGFTQSCNTCHTPNLPTVPVPTSAGPGITPFNHANIGSTDCVSCHMAIPTNIGITWAGGNLAHSASLTSCTSCHSSAQWPTRPARR